MSRVDPMQWDANNSYVLDRVSLELRRATFGEFVFQLNSLQHDRDPSD